MPDTIAERMDEMKDHIHRWKEVNSQQYLMLDPPFSGYAKPDSDKRNSDPIICPDYKFGIHELKPSVNSKILIILV